MNIQWYPGHMAKAKRTMQEDLRLVDLIIELIDARAPLASRNPDIDELGRGKSRLVLLNKADLADEKENDNWVDYFERLGFFAVKINSRSGAGVRQILPAVRKACKEKLERNRRRGIINRPVRAMVAGIPNVGKSTFINSYAGKASAKTGNKPGVTKGNQWIRLNPSLELLDTPGILWPKFDDQKAGLFLAFIGSINDEVLNREELATELLLHLCERYPENLYKRYSFAPLSQKPDARQAFGLLEDIARLRGCLGKGGEPDCHKAAGLVLDDFRSGRLGRITLETPAAAGGI